MFLSFRRSKDALLALGFFVLMVVIVFSTLLYVSTFVPVTFLRFILDVSRYFIERGKWDDTLEVFINSDGDPSQFAVSPRYLRSLFSSYRASNCGYASLYPLQRGTSLLLHSSPFVPNVSPLVGLSSSVSEIRGICSDKIRYLTCGGRTHTAISTVGYGEITPRSFFGRLITLPLLIFGLLLIALPSFVLGREFSVVWNEMAGGYTPRMPYRQSGHAYADSEQVRFFCTHCPHLGLGLAGCFLVPTAPPAVSFFSYYRARHFSRSCGPDARQVPTSSFSRRRQRRRRRRRRRPTSSATRRTASSPGPMICLRPSSRNCARRWTHRAPC